MPIVRIYRRTRKFSGIFPTPFLPLLILALFPMHVGWAVLARVFILGLALLLTGKHLLRPIPMLMMGGLVLAPLWSVNPSHSFAATLPWCAYLLLYILFRFQVLPEVTLRWGLRLLIASAIILSGYGLHQILYGYTEYFRMLETATESFLPASRAIMDEWLTGLSGRAFSRFALPSQFAIYLLMLFPLHGVLIWHERRPELRLLWGTGLILNSIMFVYTKSFGAWLTLFCLFACGLLLWLMRHQAVTWQRILAGSLISVPIMLGMAYIIGILRGQHLWNLQGNNPLWFRLLNWQAAVSMWRDHVFLGAGLSTFGILYPNYMPPGANESNYAHNSYLQIGVEYGLIGLLLICWLILRWGTVVFALLKNHRSVLPGHPPVQASFSQNFFMAVRAASAFGGLAFLLHNLIDFDVYVFPLGALGMALLALTMNSDEPLRQSPPPARVSGWVMACIGGGVLIVGMLDWQQTEARRQYEIARRHVQTQRYAEAAEASRKTFATWPIPPAYHALAGSIALFHQRPVEARQYFRTAAQAEPQTPWFHGGLAEAYLAEHNLGLAYVESRRAAELFPQKPEYAHRAQAIQDILPEFSR